MKNIETKKINLINFKGLRNQANVKKTQFVIENFNKLKIDTLEQKINSKFKFVNFKMFETQINGGEVECCDCLIYGVPFSDANTASKINAGLDIINTLCEFYQVTAPIFIDNRESIVISGRDERNLGMIFNTEGFSRKIEIQALIDDDEMFSEVDVFNKLINEIKNEN